MQVTHSPKPEIFGKGYGKHVANNFVLMKQFFWLGWKMLVNTFFPAVFYERAHWEVIELYYKMRCFRHGTKSDHRCAKCGTDFLSADEVSKERDELKQIQAEHHLIDDFDRAMEEEEYRQYLESMITPECEERIRQIDAGEIEGIPWRDLDTRIGIRGLDYAADADRAEKAPKE